MRRSPLHPMGLALVFATLTLLCGAGVAWADDSPFCPDADLEMSPERWLRAASLDLRGTIPTEDEYAVLVDDPDAVVAMVDDWLASDAFVERAVRHHRELLWNNVENVNLLNASTSLRRDPAGFYYRLNRTTTYRGLANTPCLDEPARFADDGTILTRDVDGARREGWVEVNPFWAPDQTWRVCAFDAQTRDVSPGGIPCGTRQGLSDPACGCGPDLQWCRGGRSELEVREALGEAMDRQVGAVLGDDAPYYDLFRTRRYFVNGPMAFFFRHQTELFANVRLTPSPVPVDDLPDLDWTDTETWVEIELGDHHAGILTNPAWLLRFQTNRARANRFWNSFLCRSFEAPDVELSDEDRASLDPDLQTRPGCMFCHAELEPAAAHWGRWTPNGAGWLDPDAFPATDETCRACAETGRYCGDTCNRYYVTDVLSPEHEAYIGRLQAYEFRRPWHEQNVELGPESLAMGYVGNGAVARCVASNTATWLLGRELGDDDDAWLADLTERFVHSDYRYRTLVRDIVTSDVYRRVR